MEIISDVKSLAMLCEFRLIFVLFVSSIIFIENRGKKSEWDGLKPGSPCALLLVYRGYNTNTDV